MSTRQCMNIMRMKIQVDHCLTVLINVDEISHLPHVLHYLSVHKPKPFKQESDRLIFLHSRREKLLLNRISAGRRFSDHTFKTFKTFKCLEAKRRMLIKHRHWIGRINYVSNNYLSLLDISDVDGQETVLSIQQDHIRIKQKSSPFRPSLY